MDKSLESLVQEKLDADTGFQESLAALSDDEKATKTNERRAELREAEFKSIAEKAKKDAELATNYKTRAEKAEGKLKKGETGKPGTENEEGDSQLSTADFYALTGAQVHQDDVEEVQKFAKFYGKTIPEALKEGVLKTILKDRAEVRRTAEAANTGGGKPGIHKPSGDQLLKELSQGKVPEPGSQEAEDLYYARRGVSKK